jgi:hypothetical protein
MPDLCIRVDNATSTDLLDLRQTFGNEAVERLTSTVPVGTIPPFGEPLISGLIISISATLVAGFVAWVCKQRKLQRTTLRITVTDQNGVVTTIDLSDTRYGEGEADATLVADLAKAGLQAPTTND